MSSWSLEVHEEGYIVVRGSVPLTEFQNLLKKYCNNNWRVDMQWARELDAAFVVCKPELVKEENRHAKAR